MRDAGRCLSRWIAAGIAAIAGAFAATAAAAFENTIRIRVSADRQWQCGANFFANGGQRRYQFAKVYAGDSLIGEYDFASPSDCAKVIEHVVDMPDGGRAVVTVEVEGHRYPATFEGRDRNRIFASNFFVDHNNGELLQDYAPARAGAAHAAPAPGVWRNTIELRVATGRREQCGDRFFATGGSETYRHARLSIDGVEVAKFDFAAPADCTRVVTVARDLPNNGKAAIQLEVGPYKMGADINARDRARTWNVQFFVDQIWAEIARDGE
jgi:hypothetical protein